MAASYPSALKNFGTAVAAGDGIIAAHVNTLREEVVAVETQLGVNAGILQSYTPVITGSATDPTLGDGTLTGHYVRIGNFVNAWIYWLFGSTTDKGSGTYYFTIPVACSSTIVNYLMGSWLANDTGAANYSGEIRYSSGNIRVACSVNGASYLGSSSPFAPGEGDSYRLSLSYMA